jgi:transposase
MRGRKAQMEEIREILRCYRLTRSVKGTARTLNYARNTVRDCVRWAQPKGYLEAETELPSEAELATQFTDGQKEAVVRQSLQPHEAKIKEWLDGRFTLTRMQELLVEGYGWTGSYETLKRYTQPLRLDTKACVRLEVAPGTEGQVDFGYMGLLYDPRERQMRKAWLFLMTLSHSRHCYGELVFEQKIPTWIACHRRAFEFFGGVPAKLVIDNLKAAIVKAAIYDPLANRTYYECAEHYGFVISPCKPRTPEHKGKVERGVPYVRNAFMAGRTFRDIQDANVQLLDWIQNKAGLRNHGTTHQQPRIVFENVEQKALLPLPATDYVMGLWKEAKLHTDCHVVVEGCYYSAPYRFRGETILVRLADSMVYLYHSHELIATHMRGHRKGERMTVPGHYPTEKAAYLEKTVVWCRRRAQTLGPNLVQFVETIMHQDHPMDTLRKVQGILHLAEKYPKERMDHAARRALHYQVLSYRSFKNILEAGLDHQPLEPIAPPAPIPARNYAHARPITDFIPFQTQSEEKKSWN